ncbi:hypothetical protein ABPG74_020200 [Tetrahymena malaccensis]
MFDIFQSKEEYYGSFFNDNLQEEQLNQIKDKVHLKQLLTIMSKKKLENMLPIRKEMVLCEKNCYQAVDFNNITDETADVLRECKVKCKAPLDDVIKYLDSINYLSENKMKMCTKSCKKKADAEKGNTLGVYDECLWICYNKLDRRYKEYWRNLKNDVIKKHFSKTFEEMEIQHSPQAQK